MAAVIGKLAANTLLKKQMKQYQKKKVGGDTVRIHLYQYHKLPYTHTDVVYRILTSL